MATLRQIKEKQQSVQKINKITKAMQLVSSAKSQKSIKEMRDYKDYFNKVLRIMSELTKDQKVEEKKFKGTYWVLLLSDMGLAGGYNHNIVKTALSNVGPNDEILILGNKGISFGKKHKDNASWYSIDELMNGQLMTEVITKINAAHHDRQLKVKAIYTEFINQMEFEPQTKQLLPIEKIELDDKQKENIAPTEFEPDKEELLKQLENLYMETVIVGMYREAKASENTARKNAMENATNNGNDLLHELSIQYNRGRQAKITQEISEIIGGSESLK